MSFTCAWTSSTIRGGILQNLFLKGSSSTTLISCFTKSAQPNSPDCRKKILWYSANRAWTATWFLSDHLSRPDKSSCWKNNSFLYSTVILVHWIPCVLSNFSRVSGVTSTGGTTFATTTWVTLTPLAIEIVAAIKFFTTPCNSHAPRNHFGVPVHYTQAIRQVGSITPLSGIESLHACCFPGAEFSFSHVLFWMKKCPCLPSLSHWPPSSSWLDPQFGLSQFPSELKVLFTDKLTTGLYVIHSGKLATHQFHFPLSYWWSNWWWVSPE